MNYREKLSKQVVAAILQQLTTEDENMIIFLIRDLIKTEKITDAIQALHDRQLLTVGTMIDLLCTVRRFDIIRTHFGLDRTAATLHIKKHFVTPYRYMMVKVHESLSSTESRFLRSMFDIDSIYNDDESSFISLITNLEDSNIVSRDNIRALTKSLRGIYRLDLATKLDKFGVDCKRYINCYPASPTLIKK